VDRRTALTALVVVVLAGCGTQRARQAVAPSLSPSPPPAPTPQPAPALSGPAISAGRAAQGPVTVRGGPGWTGLPAAYAYANRSRNDCAQAAVATALTTDGTWARPDRGGADRQAQLFRTSPPDVLGGVWGSSPKLVQTMLGSTRSVRGLDEVQVALHQGEPVLVMLDLSPLGRGAGAHWTVVVAVSAEQVQVTNLGGGLVRRDLFERAWTGLVPSISGVAGVGLLPPVRS
jgi:hypothetical protein